MIRLSNSSMLHGAQGFGAVDYGALWSDIKTGASDLVTKDLPKAIQKTIENKAVATVQPTVQKQVEAKASRVVSKGNIALTASIGLLAGLLVAGGSWQRRAVGGTVGGILGGLAGLKIGLVGDSA
jgi:hypothetical protein